MDCGKTGALIKELRRERGLTQMALAEKMNISDKTVSKWERGMGCPDVTLLASLSEIFGISVESLLSGALSETETENGNMKRTNFYRCPQCGALLTGTGAAELFCCGRSLKPMKAAEISEEMNLKVENVEDEWYITSSHPMTKEHSIIFAAYVGVDRMLFIRLYPEQDCAFRMPVMHGGELYLCCSRDGLMKKKM